MTDEGRPERESSPGHDPEGPRPGDPQPAEREGVLQGDETASSESDFASEDDAPAGLIAPGGKVDREALFALYERQREGDDERQVSVTFRLLRDLDKRLDRYLVDRIPFLSRTALQRLIDEGAVTLNGQRPKASTRLGKGDVVVAVLPPPPSNEIPAEEIPLDVLFEDDDLIVIDKRDDIIVHPARGNRTGTIINALAWHFLHRSAGSLSSVGREHARPGVVHRLDRHTTGVMVAAKSDTAHWRLGRQFEQRRTDKRYLALVHGRMEPHADVIDLPLGKHPTIRERYAVRWDESGKPSTTIYRVREVYREHTLVELELRTGRTHQIRVHLSHLGHPIVADDMYGGRPLRRRDLDPTGDDEPVLQRVALHAAMLGFRHPISGAPLRFEAPLHADMRLALTLLRRHAPPETVHVPGAVLDLERMLPAPDGAAG